MGHPRIDPIVIQKLIEEKDSRVNNLFCPECKIGALENHSQFMHWKKCPICSFSKEVINDVVGYCMLPDKKI